MKRSLFSTCATYPSPPHAALSRNFANTLFVLPSPRISATRELTSTRRDLPFADITMNRADVQIEDKEVITDNPGGESIGASVLRRGWWIGKRVAIAGAAITSAPIVLPPILVLSILGLALSLPYGIYLAGYACTDKIMRALLPLPLSRGYALDSGFEEMVKCVELKNDTATGSDENRNTDVSPERDGSLKSPYCVAVMYPAEDRKRENDPPNLNQERLSVVEVRGEAKSDESLEGIQPKELMEGRREEDGEDEETLDISNGVLAKEKGLTENYSCEAESVGLNSDNLDKFASMEDSSGSKSGVNAGSGSGTGVHSDDEASNFLKC
ncbi:hypothetical protein KSP40_PGU005841 [Platanthera guangdongensis]|uniref:Uncharacterized protein n=1 Tax=Platanthera guangdongensis TaxID=2320717 RepID=A0ABR2LE59_9ASPA